jgi:hypothetical protein
MTETRIQTIECSQGSDDHCPISFRVVFDSVCCTPMAVGEFVSSKPFSAYGHNWALRLYPGGIDFESTNSMSCFLVMLDSTRSIHVSSTTESMMDLSDKLSEEFYYCRFMAQRHTKHPLKDEHVNPSDSIRFTYKSSDFLQFFPNQINLQAGKRHFAPQDPYSLLSFGDSVTVSLQSPFHPKPTYFVIIVDLWKRHQTDSQIIPTFHKHHHLTPLSNQSNHKFRRLLDRHLQSPVQSYLYELRRQSGIGDVFLVIPSTGKKYPAIRSILRGRSPVFALMFSSGMQEAMTNEIPWSEDTGHTSSSINSNSGDSNQQTNDHQNHHHQQQHTSEVIIEAFLDYLHTDYIHPSIIYEHTFDMFTLAMKYQLPQLQSITEYALSLQIQESDFFARWQIAEMYNSSFLKDALAAYAANHLEQILIIHQQQSQPMQQQQQQQLTEQQQQQQQQPLQPSQLPVELMAAILKAMTKSTMTTSTEQSAVVSKGK